MLKKSEFKKYMCIFMTYILILTGCFQTFSLPVYAESDGKECQLTDKEYNLNVNFKFDSVYDSDIEGVSGAVTATSVGYEFYMSYKLPDGVSYTSADRFIYSLPEELNQENISDYPIYAPGITTPVGYYSIQDNILEIYYIDSFLSMNGKESSLAFSGTLKFDGSGKNTGDVITLNIPGGSSYLFEYFSGVGFEVYKEASDLQYETVAMTPSYERKEVAKVDENGDPVLDDNGDPVMEEVEEQVGEYGSSTPRAYVDYTITVKSLVNNKNVEVYDLLLYRYKTSTGSYNTSSLMNMDTYYANSSASTNLKYYNNYIRPYVTYESVVGSTDVSTIVNATPTSTLYKSSATYPMTFNGTKYYTNVKYTIPEMSKGDVIEIKYRAYYPNEANYFGSAQNRVGDVEFYNIAGTKSKESKLVGTTDEEGRHMSPTYVAKESEYVYNEDEDGGYVYFKNSPVQVFLRTKDDGSLERYVVSDGEEVVIDDSYKTYSRDTDHVQWSIYVQPGFLGTMTIQEIIDGNYLKDNPVQPTGQAKNIVLPDEGTVTIYGKRPGESSYSNLTTITLKELKAGYEINSHLFPDEADSELRTDETMYKLVFKSEVKELDWDEDPDSLYNTLWVKELNTYINYRRVNWVAGIYGAWTNKYIETVDYETGTIDWYIDFGTMNSTGFAVTLQDYIKSAYGNELLEDSVVLMKDDKAVSWADVGATFTYDKSKTVKTYQKTPDNYGGTGNLTFTAKYFTIYFENGMNAGHYVLKYKTKIDPHLFFTSNTTSSYSSTDYGFNLSNLYGLGYDYIMNTVSLTMKGYTLASGSKSQNLYTNGMKKTVTQKLDTLTYKINLYNFDKLYEDGMYIIEKIPKGVTVSSITYHDNSTGKDYPLEPVTNVDPLYTEEEELQNSDYQILYFNAEDVLAKGTWYSDEDKSNGNLKDSDGYYLSTEQKVLTGYIKIVTKINDYVEKTEVELVRNQVYMRSNESFFQSSLVDAAAKPYSVLSKTKQYDSTTAPLSTYTVELNPAGLQLFPDGVENATLQVVDTMGTALKLATDTIYIKTPNSDFVKISDEVSDTDIYFEKLGNRLVIYNLKDSQAYTIQYSALVVLDVGEQLDASNSTNTVEINGIAYKNNNSEVSIENMVIESAVKADSTTWFVSVFKMKTQERDEEGNLTNSADITPLNDTEFEVWNYGTGLLPCSAEDAELVGTYATNEKGETPEVQLEHDTIYRIIETKPKDGYTGSYDSGYFVRPGKSALSWNDERALKAELNMENATEEEWHEYLEENPIEEISILKGYVNYQYIVENDKKYIDIPVTKVFDDNDDEDGLRNTGDIEVELYQNGNATGNKIYLNSDNEYKGVFENLPDYDDEDKPIEYTVVENNVAEGYTYSVYGDKYAGFLITNYHMPTVTIKGEKIWNDEWNNDGLRPESIVIALTRNGEKISDVTLKDGVTEFEFADLPKYDEEWQEYEYGIDEVTEAEGYETTIEQVDDYTYEITNTHEIETFDITGKKIWIDDDNKDNTRPKEIEVNLYQNGQFYAYRPISENEDGLWTYSFEGLPVYENGEKIEWTLDDNVEGYICIPDGYDIKNVLTTKFEEGDYETGIYSNNLVLTLTIMLGSACLAICLLNRKRFN